MFRVAEVNIETWDRSRGAGNKRADRGIIGLLTSFQNNSHVGQVHPGPFTCQPNATCNPHREASGGGQPRPPPNFYSQCASRRGEATELQTAATDPLCGASTSPRHPLAMAAAARPTGGSAKAALIQGTHARRYRLEARDARKSPPLTRAEVLSEFDLYKVLGAPRHATDAELRRHYLERSRILHPDKPPALASSTEAFQRLSHAYEILKKPSLRLHYDRESASGHACDPYERSSFIAEDTTFRSAVCALLHEFLHGDFALVRKLLETLNRQYPSAINQETITGIEKAFVRMRELILTTRTYALLISIELGRIHRVQKRLFGLGYFDVLGRTRLTIQLAKVTLAVPVRMDRALQRREEREWMAKQAGWDAAGISEREMPKKGAYLLNEKVSKVLEFIAGNKMDDEEEDNEWRRYWGETSAQASQAA